ncbi:Guanylate cyclase [Aphelenchoides bicaudatus]|nr:Guanylate cyclase [Aphelenchoides bicaudatus]
MLNSLFLLLSFTWNYTQCSESLAVGYTSGMIKRQNISAMFGPTCIESAETVGALATYSKIPIFLWSTMNSEFLNRKKYPTSVSAAGTVTGLLIATANVLKKYNWTQVGFLYTEAINGHAEYVPFCTDYANTFQGSTTTYLANITTYIRFANNNSIAGFRSILNSMNTRARIIIACLETRLDRQNMMLAAASNNMTGSDYVYLFIRASATAFGDPPFWNGTDSKFAIIKEAAKSVLVLDKYAEETSMKQAVNDEIVGKYTKLAVLLQDLPKKRKRIYFGILFGRLVLYVSSSFELDLHKIRFQRQQRRRLNALWQIPFSYLQKPSDRKNSIQESSLSIQSEATQTSGNSTSTLRKETEHTEYFIYCNELVVAHKFEYNGRWSSTDKEEFCKMRKLDNPSLNHFLGISVSGPNCYVLWNFCDRGNLIEVIKTHSSKIDSHVIIGMMREICNGLSYIHKSSFTQHGNLNSYCCTVGDRFDVKIQMYGLSKLKSRMVRRQNSALYVAPEHLKGRQSKIGSQAGDIYSFGIIASVIITMKPAYGIEDVDAIDVIENTVQAVSNGSYPPTRPSLQVGNNVEIHPDLLSLVTKMWSEQPNERPKIDSIHDLLFNKLDGTRKSTNLMDHMFALMENSANELEQEVKMRTLELESEQKKADILLYRIMPREAADMLKLGQNVAPEVFESCTVFFSDIVSFTVLSSKSTPLQIINFLNDVYTLTDSVISNYDVYKVETIGDGLHVVSGVPKLNGHEHVKEICGMAIEFQRAIRTLRLSHLPDQVIQMRVGVHSGPAVAGIVGTINPRYVVLGDTVNTAAKMEASGKAGRIHITKETKDLIECHYPSQFHIVNRGETLIKGLGPMETFFCIMPEEVPNF